MNDTAFLQLFGALDLQFARFLSAVSNPADERLYLAAALLSRAVRTGDVCIDLSFLAGKTLPENGGVLPPLVLPPLAVWISGLRSSSAVGEPGQKRPLILDDRNRLYLYRYWDYEDRLARSIRERTASRFDTHVLDLLRKSMQRVFPATREGDDKDQCVAAVLAVLQRFCVITGGPGTGKTFTIAKALALFAEQAGGRPIRTLLAAPTGKAAARLRESLQRAWTGPGLNPSAHTSLPADVFTVHRLLKPIPDSPYFKHHRSNPLPAEVVIVDEASMVDLALMAKLMDAVPPDARLVLVGDKDQLASVEAGSVLADICDRGRPHDVSTQLNAAVHAVAGIRLPHASSLEPGLQDCIIELKKSYRFAADSKIGELSRATNRGDARQALEILAAASGATVTWLDPGVHPDIERKLEKRILEGYRDCFEDPAPPAALEAFSRFKILCAHKTGPLGVEALNRLAVRVLQRQGLVAPGGGGTPWYAGRPVLITRNEYSLGLFNGDIGVTLPDFALEGRPLFVFFTASAGGIRRFLPYRLPEHETAFAMTVHKSQGSEFEDILLVLPDHDSPILTRELLYTALTRSRRSITICARGAVLAACIDRRIERASGLRDALWGVSSGSVKP